MDLFIQDIFSSSIELFKMMIFPSLRNTFKGAYGILAVIRNFHHRMSNMQIELGI